MGAYFEAAKRSVPDSRVLRKLVLFDTGSCDVLGLSYNAIGLHGARLLGEAARIGGWKHSLGCLGLEMNGLGDSGCKQVASLVKQYLPALSVLELGWNEVTGASAADLAQLVRAPDSDKDAGLPVLLRRLGLAGNSLASAASKLVLAALSDPSRELELDLSMNHVDAQALRDAAEWARARNTGEVQVHLTVSLEWNTIDDPEAVRDLAIALSGAKLMVAESGQPLIQLANNELLDLQASEILDASENLIMLSTHKLSESLKESLRPRLLKKLSSKQADEVLDAFLKALMTGPVLKRGTALRFEFEKASVKIRMGEKYAAEVKSKALTSAFLEIYLDKHAVAPDFREAVFKGLAQS
eukprot:s97_g35.t1